MFDRKLENHGLVLKKDLVLQIRHLVTKRIALVPEPSTNIDGGGLLHIPFYYLSNFVIGVYVEPNWHAHMLNRHPTIELCEVTEHGLNPQETRQASVKRLLERCIGNISDLLIFDLLTKVWKMLETGPKVSKLLESAVILIEARNTHRWCTPP